MHTVLWLLKARVKKEVWFFWELVKRNEKDGSESNSKIPAEASSERFGYMDLMRIFDKVT